MRNGFLTIQGGWGHPPPPQSPGRPPENLCIVIRPAGTVEIDECQTLRSEPEAFGLDEISDIQTREMLQGACAPFCTEH
ncbi:MAG: hypothetical protein AAFW01_00430 [Pseudomonadota bacterium]